MARQSSCAVCLDRIQHSFTLTTDDLHRIVRFFHADMSRGLAGKKSSLKMLPAYVARPTGAERGAYIALDLGGTNFRILAVGLKGNGRTGPVRVMTYALRKEHTAGSADALFGFIAGCVKSFMKRHRLSAGRNIGLGFTFSFPVRQTGIASGILVCWTKDFSARGVVGTDVVGQLRRALARKGLGHVDVAALANDTVGTLVARSYADRSCDVGVIIGTGTNACYPEKMSRIRIRPGMDPAAREMIINIEWGNFNKLERTSFDRSLDRVSDNPGSQILEKMVSGMYLGEIVRLVMADLVRAGMLLRVCKGNLPGRKEFATKYVSRIEADSSAGLEGVKKILSRAGLRGSTLADRRIIKDICAWVSTRGARIAAAAILAVITRMDPSLRRAHTVALDGSVYEKHPFFARRMALAFRELLPRKAGRIRMVLAKDGSGKGAAIIAAVAYGNTHSGGR